MQRHSAINTSSYTAPAAIFLAFVLLFLTCVSVPFAQDIRLFTLVDDFTGGSIRFGLWGYCLGESVENYPTCTKPELGWNFDNIPTLTGLENSISSMFTNVLLIHPFVTAGVFIIFILTIALALRISTQRKLRTRLRRKPSFSSAPFVFAFVAAILTTAAFIVDIIIISDVKAHVRQATGTIRNMKAHTGAIPWLSCVAMAVLWASLIMLHFLEKDGKTPDRSSRDDDYESDASLPKRDSELLSTNSTYDRRASNYSSGNRRFSKSDDDRYDDGLRSRTGYDRRSPTARTRSESFSDSADDYEDEDSQKKKPGILAALFPCLGKDKDKEKDEDIELSSMNDSRTVRATDSYRNEADDLRRRKSWGTTDYDDDDRNTPDGDVSDADITSRYSRSTNVRAVPVGYSSREPSGISSTYSERLSNPYSNSAISPGAESDRALPNDRRNGGLRSPSPLSEEDAYTSRRGTYTGDGGRDLSASSVYSNPTMLARTATNTVSSEPPYSRRATPYHEEEGERSTINRPYLLSHDPATQTSGSQEPRLGAPRTRTDYDSTVLSGDNSPIASPRYSRTDNAVSGVSGSYAPDRGRSYLSTEGNNDDGIRESIADRLVSPTYSRSRGAIDTAATPSERYTPESARYEATDGEGAVDRVTSLPRTTPDSYYGVSRDLTTRLSASPEPSYPEERGRRGGSSYDEDRSTGFEPMSGTRASRVISPYDPSEDRGQSVDSPPYSPHSERDTRIFGRQSTEPGPPYSSYDDENIASPVGGTPITSARYSRTDDGASRGYTPDRGQSFLLTGDDNEDGGIQEPFADRSISPTYSRSRGMVDSEASSFEKYTPESTRYEATDGEGAVDRVTSRPRTTPDSYYGVSRDPTTRLSASPEPSYPEEGSSRGESFYDEDRRTGITPMSDTRASRVISSYGLSEDRGQSVDNIPYSPPPERDTRIFDRQSTEPGPPYSSYDDESLVSPAGGTPITSPGYSRTGNGVSRASGSYTPDRGRSFRSISRAYSESRNVVDTAATSPERYTQSSRFEETANRATSRPRTIPDSYYGVSRDSNTGLSASLGSSYPEGEGRRGGSLYDSDIVSPVDNSPTNSPGYSRAENAASGVSGIYASDRGRSYRSISPIYSRSRGVVDTKASSFEGYSPGSTRYEAGDGEGAVDRVTSLPRTIPVSSYGVSRDPTTGLSASPGPSYPEGGGGRGGSVYNEYRSSDVASAFETFSPTRSSSYDPLYDKEQSVDSLPYSPPPERETRIFDRHPTKLEPPYSLRDDQSIVSPIDGSPITSPGPEESPTGITVSTASSGFVPDRGRSYLSTSDEAEGEGGLQEREPSSVPVYSRSRRGVDRTATSMGGSSIGTTPHEVFRGKDVAERIFPRPRTISDSYFGEWSTEAERSPPVNAYSGSSEGNFVSTVAPVSRDSTAGSSASPGPSYPEGRGRRGGSFYDEDRRADVASASGTFSPVPISPYNPLEDRGRSVDNHPYMPPPQRESRNLDGRSTELELPHLSYDGESVVSPAANSSIARSYSRTGNGVTGVSGSYAPDRGRSYLSTDDENEDDRIQESIAGRFTSPAYSRPRGVVNRTATSSVRYTSGSIPDSFYGEGTTEDERSPPVNAYSGSSEGNIVGTAAPMSGGPTTKWTVSQESSYPEEGGRRGPPFYDEDRGTRTAATSRSFSPIPISSYNSLEDRERSVGNHPYVRPPQRESRILDRRFTELEPPNRPYDDHSIVSPVDSPLFTSPRYSRTVNGTSGISGSYVPDRRRSYISTEEDENEDGIIREPITDRPISPAYSRSRGIVNTDAASSERYSPGSTPYDESDGAYAAQRATSRPRTVLDSFYGEGSGVGDQSPIASAYSRSNEENVVGTPAPMFRRPTTGLSVSRELSYPEDEDRRGGPYYDEDRRTTAAPMFGTLSSRPVSSYNPMGGKGQSVDNPPYSPPPERETRILDRQLPEVRPYSLHNDENVDGRYTSEPGRPYLPNNVEDREDNRLTEASVNPPSSLAYSMSPGNVDTSAISSERFSPVVGDYERPSPVSAYSGSGDGFVAGTAATTRLSTSQDLTYPGEEGRRGSSFNDEYRRTGTAPTSRTFSPLPISSNPPSNDPWEENRPYSPSPEREARVSDRQPTVLRTPYRPYHDQNIISSVDNSPITPGYSRTGGGVSGGYAPDRRRSYISTEDENEYDRTQEPIMGRSISPAYSRSRGIVNTDATSSERYSLGSSPYDQPDGEYAAQRATSRPRTVLDSYYGEGLGVGEQSPLASPYSNTSYGNVVGTAAPMSRHPTTRLSAFRDSIYPGEEGRRGSSYDDEYRRTGTAPATRSFSPLPISSNDPWEDNRPYSPPRERETRVSNRQPTELEPPYRSYNDESIVSPVGNSTIAPRYSRMGNGASEVSGSYAPDRRRSYLSTGDENERYSPESRRYEATDREGAADRVTSLPRTTPDPYYGMSRDLTTGMSASPVSSYPEGGGRRGGSFNDEDRSTGTAPMSGTLTSRVVSSYDPLEDRRQSVDNLTYSPHPERDTRIFDREPTEPGLPYSPYDDENIVSPVGGTPITSARYSRTGNGVSRASGSYTPDRARSYLPTEDENGDDGIQEPITDRSISRAYSQSRSVVDTTTTSPERYTPEPTSYEASDGEDVADRVTSWLRSIPDSYYGEGTAEDERSRPTGTHSGSNEGNLAGTGPPVSRESSYSEGGRRGPPFYDEDRRSRTVSTPGTFSPLPIPSNDPLDGNVPYSPSPERETRFSTELESPYRPHDDSDTISPVDDSPLTSPRNSPMGTVDSAASRISRSYVSEQGPSYFSIDDEDDEDRGRVVNPHAFTDHSSKGDTESFVPESIDPTLRRYQPYDRDEVAEEETQISQPSNGYDRGESRPFTESDSDEDRGASVPEDRTNRYSSDSGIDDIGQVPSEERFSSESNGTWRPGDNVILSSTTGSRGRVSDHICSSGDDSPSGTGMFGSHRPLDGSGDGMIKGNLGENVRICERCGAYIYLY